MKKNARLFAALSFVGLVIILISGTGCANIIPPGGGPRDTIPPVLVAESPRDSATNVSTKKINFVFNEYVELQNTQENVVVSPNPINSPVFDYKLRTVTVRLRDTLEPNTTYSINFGNAIKDINEGNVFKDFYYIFSTGGKIDAGTLSGKVTLAETGKADSTLIVVLHKNIDDSAVVKERPRYIAKLDSSGNFKFRNLPEGTFAIYALTNDYSKRFDETKLFAFANKPVTIAQNNAPVNLLAYVETVKKTPAPAVPAPKAKPSKADSVIRFSTNLEGSSLDVLAPLQLTFNRKVQTFDSTKVSLTTADYTPVKNYTITSDTTSTIYTIQNNWPINTPFRLILKPGAFADMLGRNLGRTDTLNFTTKPAEAYGSLKIRFSNLDTSKHPVLLFIQNQSVVYSVPITRREWSQKLFKPGDYEVRILFDENRNGKWDAGQFFEKHRQPEVVKFITDKFNVRENWDNEKEISSH